jgi:hypothetical protein
MKFHHKIPCNECPWRKESAPGWLGGHGAEFYADALALNEAPACHLRDFGPFDDETALCVGALHTAKNGCISLYRAAGDADSAKDAVGRSDECFGHHSLFFRHHTGRQYQSPLIRALSPTTSGDAK